MRLLRTGWKTAAIAALGLLAVVAAVPLAVGAASGDPTSTPSTTSTLCQRDDVGGQGWGARLLTGLIDQGIISQDQADQIRGYVSSEAETACVSGHLLAPYDVMQVSTQVLGLTEREIVSALREGQSLADLAAQQGVAVEDLTNALKTEATDNGAWYVSQGKLTQEQVDAALAGIDERLQTIVERQGLPDRPGSVRERLHNRMPEESGPMMQPDVQQS